MLGFAPLSDLPFSDLPAPAVVLVPASNLTSAALNESNGAQGGYLVPPEQLSLEQWFALQNLWRQRGLPDEEEDEDEVLSLLL